jgi:hypothetical protein
VGLRLLAFLPRLLLGLGQDLVRFFLGLEDRLFLARFGVASRVVEALDLKCLPASRAKLGPRAADGI